MLRLCDLNVGNDFVWFMWFFFVILVYFLWMLNFSFYWLLDLVEIYYNLSILSFVILFWKWIGMNGFFILFVVVNVVFRGVVFINFVLFYWLSIFLGWLSCWMVELKKWKCVGWLMMSLIFCDGILILFFFFMLCGII